MKRLATLVFSGLTVVAAPATAQPAAEDPGITVSLENGVSVYRGHIDRQRAKSVPEKRGTVVAGSGRTLWLFDQDRSRLSACRVRQTSTVGLDVIRCTPDRSLP